MSKSCNVKEYITAIGLRYKLEVTIASEVLPWVFETKTKNIITRWGRLYKTLNDIFINRPMIFDVLTLIG